jgi:hypothetical protein
VRIGVDRDELDACTDPADPASFPGDGTVCPCAADLDGDGVVGFFELLSLLSLWGPCPGSPGDCPEDLDGDGVVGLTDLLIVLAAWGPCR